MPTDLSDAAATGGLSFHRLRTGPREGAELDGLERVEIPPLDPGNCIRRPCA